MSTVLDNIKKKLSAMESIPTDSMTPRYGWNNPKYANLDEPTVQVMAAYQNANRWLDTLKENAYIYLGCPYFSHIIHELAHEMPKRFDKFGDILHTENLEIPYPSTEEWRQPVGNIKDTINYVYDILESIVGALLRFKDVAESSGLPAMSMECDVLIAELTRDRVFFIKAEEFLETSGNNVNMWDMRVYQYWKDKNSLN